MAKLSLEDRAAIGDAAQLFYHLVDVGRASETAELFVDDATLTFGPGSPKPGTITGAAIRDAMVVRESQTSAFTRHVMTNLSFTNGEGFVGLQYLLTLYRSDDETRSSVPAFVADVNEQWRQHDCTWLIVQRTITPAFARS